MLTEESFFSLPAYPLETVIDPTGAGDSFAGGFVGYVARHLGEGLSDDVLRRAMVYGTAIASHNVEEFGTERLERLGAGEVDDRVQEIKQVTHFDYAPVELVG